MPLKIGGVELATRPDVACRIAGHNASATQPIETLCRRTRFALQDATYDVTQHSILREQNEDATQMITKRSFISISLSLKGGERHALSRHLVKTAPHQIWMAADQPKV